ncbi:UNVERIFIED_CONTAM: hypothetical protein Slati_1137600 [Sesamum latifolium]|uniref:Uncharacterized protein n=1 Tax=Sesamum latifolium TaxID=2727402 RepID=A0AAW2XDB2_9LAMI
MTENAAVEIEISHSEPSVLHPKLICSYCNSAPVRLCLEAVVGSSFDLPLIQHRNVVAHRTVTVFAAPQLASPLVRTLARHRPRKARL